MVVIIGPDDSIYDSVQIAKLNTGGASSKRGVGGGRWNAGRASKTRIRPTKVGQLDDVYDPILQAALAGDLE